MSSVELSSTHDPARRRQLLSRQRARDALDVRGLVAHGRDDQDPRLHPSINVRRGATCAPAPAVDRRGASTNSRCHSSSASSVQIRLASSSAPGGVAVEQAARPRRARSSRARACAGRAARRAPSRQVAAQPVAERDREALLGPVEDLVGQPAAQRLAQDPLLLGAAHLEIGGDRGARAPSARGRAAASAPRARAPSWRCRSSRSGRRAGRWRRRPRASGRRRVAAPRRPARADRVLGWLQRRDSAANSGRVERVAAGPRRTRTDVAGVAVGGVERQRAGRAGARGWRGSTIVAAVGQPRCRRGERRAAAAPGMRSSRAGHAVGDVARVAGEGLVAAVAVERDGDVAARHLGEVEARDRRGVGERLAVVAHDLAAARRSRRRAPRTPRARCRSARRSPRACGSSSKRSLSKPIENVRTGCEEASRHRGDDRGRVDAAREEGAERHVGDQPAPGRVAEPVADPLADLLARARRACARSRAASSARASTRAVAQTSVWAGGSLRTRAEGAERRRHVAEREVAVDRAGSTSRGIARVLQQRAASRRRSSASRRAARRAAASCRRGRARAAAGGAARPRARRRTCRAGARTQSAPCSS